MNENAIKISHYSDKETYKKFSTYSNETTYDLVSYETKKGNIKIVKSRQSKPGKITKSQYRDLVGKTLSI
jgi:hypothetical protein